MLTMNYCADESGQQGFTVVELMIAVVIVSIFTAIATPAFTNIIRTNRIAANVNDFVGAVNYARSEAIKRRADITLAASSSVATNEFGGGWVVSDAGTALRTYAGLGDSVTLDSSGNYSSFTFNSRGFLGSSSNADTLILCGESGDRGRRILLTSMGNIRIDRNYVCP